MHKTITRILLFLLAFMIVFSCIYSVFAAGISEEDMTAASILLVQAETGSVLYEKEADARRAPASTTKLLTAVLALENMQLDDEVTVPPEAQTNGSNMGLKPGQVVTVETLLWIAAKLRQRRGRDTGHRHSGDGRGVFSQDERKGGRARHG